ncbi:MULTISPECIES: Rieske (2Fe-2S) protein [unclassified Gluconobacter]|uniref:Rieske (2Fe-2S) protein n=1 Tax=unclassified Gluconobacter TaxID=2644261 RepID=UPI001C047C3B|nr:MULTISPECIES: Rieske (2Fe-2S) protein [unclassified Gluconobacter]
MTGWFPVALSMDVPAGTAAPARLSGKEIALWRGTDGEIHAWEDRCPHRGMRLSFGFVRNGNLACLYHGWQFGADSTCRHIPAHPELRVPGTIRATAYQVQERCGMIWVSLDETPSLSPMPEGEASGVRSLLVQVPLQTARTSLNMEASNWKQQDNCLFAVHEPAVGLTMLHVASWTVAGQREAARQAVQLRDRLEAIKETVSA